MAWCDGPTVARLRHAARNEVSGGPGIDALVHRGRVRYQRGLSLTAVAVWLVTCVRAGGSPPDLEDIWQAGAWQGELEQTDFPERARSPEEQALAELLVDRGLSDYQRALAAWDHARAQGRRAVASPLPQVLLCRAVAAFGLDGLAALAHAEEVVAVAARELADGHGLGDGHGVERG